MQMNVKTYHITCCALFACMLLSQWFCFGVVLLSWWFQLGNIVLTKIMLDSPSNEGVQRRLERKYYEHSGVSILKPLCGAPVTLYENLRTYFTLQYPVFELIFCVADEDDPALEVVKKLQEEFPEVSTIVSTGTKDAGVNPKVCNLATGYDAVNWDLVWIADANIVASDAALQDMVDKCVSGSRLVHQLPWTVSGPAVEATLGAISCGSILERWYFASAHGRPYTVLNHAVCTCLNGMSNLFSKHHMDAIGGLEQFGTTLNEDAEIGLAFDQHGYTTSISKHVAVQNIGPIGICDYVDRRVRWTQLRNKYTKTRWTAPFEVIVDSHVASLMCLSLLVYCHGVGSPVLLTMHQGLWLLCDCIVFMLMDRAIALPISWQEFRLDWGRVTKTNRGFYFYMLNMVQHYAMWWSREFITMYIRLNALRNTEQIVWKDQELPLPENSEEDTKSD